MLKIKEFILPHIHSVELTVPYKDTPGHSVTVAFRGAAGQVPGAPPKIDWHIWQGTDGYTEANTEEFAVALSAAAFLARAGSVNNAIGLVDTGSTTQLPFATSEVMRALRNAEIVRQ